MDPEVRRRCTRGHEWTDNFYAPEILQITAIGVQKVFCLRCLLELLEQQLGQVKTVTDPVPGAVVED